MIYNQVRLSFCSGIFANDPESALAEARRAVESNPYDAFAHNSLGATLALACARYDEGILCFQRALQLNPTDPQSYLYLTQLALAWIGGERYELAVDNARDALRHNPDFLEAQIVLASSLGYLGRTKEALSAIAQNDVSARQYVESHIVYARDLKDRLIVGLRKAGLPEE